MTEVGVATLQEVEVDALDAARFEPLVGPERMARFEAVAEATRERLGGRAVVNVNSTAVGGGVAEMLQTLLAYARGRASTHGGSSSGAMRRSSRSRSGSTTASRAWTST